MIWQEARMPTPTGTVEGLEDVVAGTTAICTVDGINGRRIYRGYDIRDLAEHATFDRWPLAEGMASELWAGEYPC
jgi:citrate synthase